MEKQLVFVYNAGSDFYSLLTDFAHKILSPSTYQCQLCALTFGNFSQKQEWKQYIQGLPIKAVFLHKDEFEKLYKLTASLPAIFIVSDKTVQEVISREQITGCNNLEDLQDLVDHAIKVHV